jgi:hypothetical protein
MCVCVCVGGGGGMGAPPPRGALSCVCACAQMREYTVCQRVTTATHLVTSQGAEHSVGHPPYAALKGCTVRNALRDEVADQIILFACRDGLYLKPKELTQWCWCWWRG